MRWTLQSPSLDRWFQKYGLLRGRSISAKTVTVKVKYSDFQQVTRSRTQPHVFMSEAEILSIAESLLETVYPFRKGVRLLGVTLSSLSEEKAQSPAQLPLFA